VAVSAVASNSAKTAIERQSKEVSLARTNDFLGIYGGLVSMCLGMSGKRRVAWRSATAWHVNRPCPFPFALGRAASSRAAVHPATALSNALGRAAWRARSGSSAALITHGVGVRGSWFRAISHRIRGWQRVHPVSRIGVHRDRNWAVDFPALIRGFRVSVAATAGCLQFQNGRRYPPNGGSRHVTEKTVTE